MKQFYKKYREIFQAEELTRTQKDIITILINRAEYHNFQSFYCYENWIADEVRCSEKTVKRAIKHFADLGLITINRTYNKQNKKTINYYIVNIDTSSNEVVTVTDNVVSVAAEQEEVATTNERVFDWDSIKGNDLIEMPQTNTDDYEIGTGCEDLDAYFNSEEYQEQLRKEEEYIKNNTEENDNNMIDIDNTYIPDELVYNDAFEVDLKDCKRVDKPTTTTTINNDVLNNVKEWLLNNLGKKTTSTVYFKGIMAKYNYTYQTVLNAVKKLNEDGIINYQPTMEGNKVLHTYSSNVLSEDKELKFVVDFLKYTKYRVQQYVTDVKQLPKHKQDLYKSFVEEVQATINMYVGVGVDKQMLIGIVNDEIRKQAA